VIEAKVAQIMTTFGVQIAAMPRQEVAPGSAESELLNGPQLPSNAMDQSDIDKLLASFG
jgi:chemotaxis protein CheZ